MRLLQYIYIARDNMEPTMVIAEVILIRAPTKSAVDELLAIVRTSDAMKELDLDKTMEPEGMLLTGTDVGVETSYLSARSSPVVPSRSKTFVRGTFAPEFPLPEDDDLELLAVGPQ
jgi:hypothetical protein